MSATGGQLDDPALRALIHFQTLFKHKLALVRKLNIMINDMRKMLISVSNGIIRNYEMNVLTIEQYRKHMESAESLAEQLPVKPLTIRTLTFKAVSIKYKVRELVKCCGALTSLDIIQFFGGGSIDVDLLTIFNPVAVKITPASSPSGITLSKYTAFTLSMVLKLHGAEMSIPIGNTVLTIKGYFSQDPFNLARKASLSSSLSSLSLESLSSLSLDQTLVDGYLTQLSLRDCVTMDATAIMNMMTSDFKDLKFMREHTPSQAWEFLLRQGVKKQVALLSLLLLDKNMHHYVQKSKSGSGLGIDPGLLHWSVKKIYDALKDDNDDNVPYETRIERLNASETVKQKAREKLKEIRGSRENSDKAVKYLDGLLRIPFGIYAKNFDTDKKGYLDYVSDTLESCIHGQPEAKRSVKSVIAQWITGGSTGAVFGFQGYPGTGKTSLAKHGIAKCIKGNPRPFFFISLGGAKGGSSLLGHSYTYVGSQCGKLAECLQNGKVMNPILYFDELDKVSDSPCGEEIIRILTHLTDPEQNDHIEDRYFGIDMDLSKALIIFSYNDNKKIDRVLMDRIHEIQFKPYNSKDKLHIARTYLIPNILKGLNLNLNLKLTDEVIMYIIDKYTCESGVRNIKEKLTHIARDINLRMMYEPSSLTLTLTSLTLTLTLTLIDEILDPVNKIQQPVLALYPQIGVVNGLYATDIGTGGLTVIQVSSTPSDKKFHIELTGSLGEVMKESVMCAKTVSWAVLPDEDRVWGDDALHIHFPSAGTSKDGPSAGVAITLAVVSYFSRLPVRHGVALTGEIDIHGNVLPIGGLTCKLEGARKAGMNAVLIPRLNLKDLKDEAITVIPVDNIDQVIRFCLIGAETKPFRETTLPFNPSLGEPRFPKFLI